MASLPYFKPYSMGFITRYGIGLGLGVGFLHRSRGSERGRVKVRTGDSVRVG